MWDIGVRCCTVVVVVVVVSWLLQTDSDGIPYHAYLGMRAADIHIKTHMHTAAPINRSISQSISQSFLRSVSRSRQIESYRVRGAASLHHAARRSLKSPPGGLAHLSLLPVLAALPCCYPSAPLPLTWASVDGPELDEHAPCGRSLGVSE